MTFNQFALLTGLRRGTGRWWIAAIVSIAVLAVDGMSRLAQAASLELRVAIEDGVKQVKVGSSTKAIVLNGSGERLGEIAAMNAFVADRTPGGVALDTWKGKLLWVEPVDGGYVWIGDRWYRGRALIVPTEKGVTAINYVDLEQYLYSVLGREMGKDWPLEALKAQAVAARSYALYQQHQSSNRPYDLGNTQAWQVYQGIEDESAGTQSAVNSTEGQVLTYNGQIILAAFHSSAGGCTENSEDVWVEALPYLRSVKDYDQTSPVYQWSQTITPSELSSRIPGAGNIVSITTEKATECGLVKSLRVVGEDGKPRSITGEALQTALGLKSAKFKITPIQTPVPEKGKTQTAPTGFLITGNGFGHGLGLSQYGAKYLAEQRASYQAILLHYYQNTGLSKIQVK